MDRCQDWTADIFGKRQGQNSNWRGTQKEDGDPGIDEGQHRTKKFVCRAKSFQEINVLAWILFKENMNN